MAPVVDAFFAEGPPVTFVFWDGTALFGDHGSGVVRINSPDALRHLIWAPGELGLARAFVSGAIEAEGDLIDLLATVEHETVSHRLTPRALASGIDVARKLGVVGLRPPTPSEEARPLGIRHSLGRDAQAVSHHYDVGNDFYRLVLGPTMTYSCARFPDHDTSLEQAQRAKFDLVCRKLDLHRRPGTRLLDVGCGWGSLAAHAARHYGATVVALTISAEQADWARRNVESEGLSAQVEIRLQDYRELRSERFGAISSVGMFEHVGSKRAGEYFSTLHDHLEPGGRLLNHAISSVGGSKLGSHTFVGRYVFPDGELIDLGDVVHGMQRAGFEVRDVESLREHYARTLRAWVTNLERNWDRATELVGVGRARVWRLYMAASAVGFGDGGISIHQTLGVRPRPDGDSGMAATRSEYC